MQQTKNPWYVKVLLFIAWVILFHVIDGLLIKLVGWLIAHLIYWGVMLWIIFGSKKK